MDTKNRPEGVAISLEPNTPVGYANVVLITHSPYEFFLDFALIQPGQNPGKVLTRFVSSPIHAKKLAEALAANVAMYESRFGPIKDPAPPPPPATPPTPWPGSASPPPGFS